MIGLDTNVLVRYITQDDPAQAAKAAALLESLTAAEPGFISLVVTAELAWVLERTYRLGRGPLAAVVERLLQTETLRVQNDTEVFAAMLELRHGHADFADALIAALARSAGCRHTATFDRRALRLAGSAGGSLEMPRAERTSPGRHRSPPSSDQRERPSGKWRATPV